MIWFNINLMIAVLAVRAESIWRRAQTSLQGFILVAALVCSLCLKLGYRPRYRQPSDQPLGKEFLHAAI